MHGCVTKSPWSRSGHWSFQMQGLLLSVKDIFGTMMAAALVVAVVSAFIPFHKAIRVKVVKTGEDMV